MIYLDNSATTRPFDEVIDCMSEINKNIFGNPSSLHGIGIEAEKIISAAEKQILKSLSDMDGRIVFTSGGTECNNQAVIGSVGSAIKRSPKIITSQIEHPSVTEAFRHLEELGAKASYVPVSKDGVVMLDELEKLMDSDTVLVSIMAVNNEVGSVQPLAEISNMIKKINPRVIFHVDAVQGYGKIPINVKKLAIDLLSVSGHKINGPKGIGALYVRKGLNLKPILFGGGQQKNLRSGTQNVPAIGGLSLASELTMKHIEQNSMNRVKNRFIEGLEKIKGAKINGGNGEKSAPHIISVAFPGLKSEVLLHALEARGVYVSTGSACSSNKPQKSSVLLAMGVDNVSVDGTVRISLGYDTAMEQADEAVDIIREESAKLYQVVK